MKVIAELPEEKYLVEINRNEIAKLRGFYSPYASGYEKPIINHTYNITEVYDKYHKILEVQKDLKSDKVKKELERMISAFTPIKEHLDLMS